MLTKLHEIHLLVFFISCFTALVTSSINTNESSNDFIILTLSHISSLEINKVTHSHKVFIAFEVKLIPNPGKLSLAKWIATFVSAIFPNLANPRRFLV